MFWGGLYSSTEVQKLSNLFAGDTERFVYDINKVIDYVALKWLSILETLAWTHVGNDFKRDRYIYWCMFKLFIINS